VRRYSTLLSHFPYIRLTPKGVHTATQGHVLPETSEKRVTRPMVSVRGFHLRDSSLEAAWKRRDVTAHTVVIQREGGELRAPWNAS
jgi:hypothetical protein